MGRVRHFINGMTNRETNTNIGGTMTQMTIEELHQLLDQVDVAAPDEWKQIAARAMEYLIGRGEDFTADDLQMLLEGVGAGPSEPNRVGALFNVYSRKGLITFAGRFTHSTRYTSHRRLLRVWRPS